MRHVVALAALLLAPGVASAAPPRADDFAPVIVDHAPGESNVTHTIYLNRCVGGCTVFPGNNDASLNTSSIIAQTAHITEFQYSDAVWNAVLACVQDTYAPYDVQVVDTEPSGTDYIEAMVAGSPSEIGQGSNVLGYSPMATDCSPQRDWISFCFANIHGVDPTIELCNTIAHETGHVMGLDHTMTCEDPMSYGQGCGQKHFLNLNMECGETQARPCRCGDKLDTHRQLFEALGAGTPVPPPMVSIPYPDDQTTVDDGFAMFGDVVEPRWIDRVEFWLNDFPWSRQEGVPGTTTYSYNADARLPDGVIHLEVRAYNDLQLEGTADVTVTKGSPCTSASTCLDGQMCNDGACAWPPPTLSLGDACERDADCDTYRCESDGSHQLCSDLCVVGDDTTCGDGFTCIEAGDKGECWPSDLVSDGGCCSVDGSGGGAGAGLLTALLLGMGRRRRARSC